MKLYIRYKNPEGKRRHASATGGPKDPLGTFTIAYFEGKLKWHPLPDVIRYQDAVRAMDRFENQWKARQVAKAAGLKIEGEGAEQHTWRACLDSYINHLELAHQPRRKGWKYQARGIRARKKNIIQFAELIGKRFVEEYTTEDLLRYRDYLYSLGRVNDTVLNKLACVVTWLKHNKLKRIVDLLPAEERPKRKEPEPRPYSAAEVKEQMARATDVDKLLARLAYNAGMRKMELAHARKSDLDPINKTIEVVERSDEDGWKQEAWTPKTPKGVRVIPIGDNLLRDLLAMKVKPNGLFWPNTEGSPDINIHERLEAIGKAARVKTRKGWGWCHRWRDTCADAHTNMVKLLRDRDLNRYMGWEGQGGENSPMLANYAKYASFDDPDVRRAANMLDVFGEDKTPAEKDAEAAGKLVRIAS